MAVQVGVLEGFFQQADPVEFFGKRPDFRQQGLPYQRYGRSRAIGQDRPDFFQTDLAAADNQDGQAVQADEYGKGWFP